MRRWNISAYALYVLQLYGFFPVIEPLKHWQEEANSAYVSCPSS